MSQELISEMLHQAAPMVRNFASKHGLDFDDLLQEASLAILEALPKVPAGARVYAYLQTSIRHRLLKLLQKQHPARSLDAPLGEGELTLGELQTDPAPVVHDEATEDRRQEALYAALHALPLEEQRYLREVYGLNAFNPLPPSWPYRANEDRSRHAIRQRAFKQLRRNTMLREAVCHE